MATNPKELAGYKAVDDHVKSGMIVGLGTGSTAFFAVERLAQKLNSGELKDIVGIPTSERTRDQAEGHKIPLCTLDDVDRPLDVAIDGADSVDRSLNLIKGGGGAMHRERMVEVASSKFIVIVDDSKLTPAMGAHFPLPVEISKFCHVHTIRQIEALPGVAEGKCTAVLRRGDCSNNKKEPDAEPAVTDNDNFVVDLHFEQDISDASGLAAQLLSVVGVVDHGLFVNMAQQVIVAGKDGNIRVAGEGGEKPWW